MSFLIAFSYNISAARSRIWRGHEYTKIMPMHLAAP